MAWLYLPGVEDSNSDSPLLSELITEQSPTLKGNVRPLRSWLRTWNAGGWIRLLSGMTLQPSQAMSLAHSWIRSTLSQRDSLASRGQSQAAKKEPMTSDGSGLSYSDWFARYDPEASSWRTSQVSFMEELNTFSETWPRSGSVRNGKVSERQTLARPIAGSGSSSWPTVRANDPEKRGNISNDPRHGLPAIAQHWATPVGHDHKSEKSTLGRSLGREAHQWQTPAAYLGKTRNPDGHKGENLLMLPGQAENWATPMAADSAQGDIENENTKYVTTGTGRLRKISNNGESGSLRLAREVKHWATPTASDDEHKVTVNSSQPGLVGEVDHFNGRPVHKALKVGGKLSKSDQTSLPRLNPKFVEWLMGWPEGWVGLTNSESSATE